MRFRQIPRPVLALVLILLASLLGLALVFGLSRNAQSRDLWLAPRQTGTTTAVVAGGIAPALKLPTQRPPNVPILTPTPDQPHPLPTMRADPESYVVQPGDSLGQIAGRYGVSVDQVVQENGIANPDLLAVGQALTIPVPTPAGFGPSFKIIPDSELVYGPVSTTFDLEAFLNQQSGYLVGYREDVEGKSLTGAQIVQRVVQDYSVNPRLLLAVLQHQSGWLTNPEPDEVLQEYPLGLRNPQRKGLYRQLVWAANQLNRGYYLYRVNGAANWVLGDNRIVPIDPTINAGTAAVQYFYASLSDWPSWELSVTEQGLFATYQSFFGYPFDYAVEPLVPPDLTQPNMQLPFEAQTVWAFTSGPHGAWGDGTAWGALDFAPPGDKVGCVLSDDWVVAVATGLILRADNGVVIQDLDGDGYEQTGWVVLYLHIESRDRVLPGKYIKAGERIGHPSCEGGVSTGTHVHLARRYNGEWIAADQDIPFILDGWVSSGTGAEYDGYLRRGDQILEAYAGRNDQNGIQR